MERGAITIVLVANVLIANKAAINILTPKYVKFVVSTCFCFFDYKNCNPKAIAINMQAVYTKPVFNICFYFSNYKTYNAKTVVASMPVTKTFY